MGIGSRGHPFYRAYPMAQIPNPKNGEGSTRKAQMAGKPLRRVGEVEGNPVGLDRETCKLLAGQLDRHLATYAVLYHQYHKHHWLVMGPQFRDLHLHLEEYYEEVHEHFDQIAERLTVLGAIPTSSPSGQEKLAYIRHEPEGQFHVREMLELDILAEKQICVELRKSIKAAFEHGDYGTKRLLEKWLGHAEERAHHLEHFLEADTLEVGLTASADEVQEDPALESMD